MLLRTLRVGRWISFEEKPTDALRVNILLGICLLPWPAKRGGRSIDVRYNVKCCYFKKKKSTAIAVGLCELQVMGARCTANTSTVMTYEWCLSNQRGNSSYLCS